MSSKDRNNVLKELKKQARKHRGGLVNNGIKVKEGVVSGPSETSQASVNKDWHNWVVLHGDEDVAVEDVWGIGKAIGVRFNGGKANMFDVLFRKGRRRQIGEEGSVVLREEGKNGKRGCLEGGEGAGLLLGEFGF